jgi:riboflavin biosynthesis pyrimidine reductase
VTRSIEFDWKSPFFASSHPRPILLVPGSADPKKREQAALHADVIPCGDQTVDLLQAMEILRDGGINTLLCEGGGQFLVHGLVLAAQRSTLRTTVNSRFAARREATITAWAHKQGCSAIQIEIAANFRPPDAPKVNLSALMGLLIEGFGSALH